MPKDTAFNGETTPSHTILCSDSQCLPPGDPKILCAKHEYPITGKSFIGEAADQLRPLSVNDAKSTIVPGHRFSSQAVRHFLMSLNLALDKILIRSFLWRRNLSLVNKTLN